MTIKDCTLLALINIIGFYGLKNYNDLRQVRLVNTLLPSIVEVSTIGPIFKRIPHENFYGNSEDISYTYEKVGFGRVNKGSGVIVSSDGLILTCAHIVKRSSLVQISLEGFSVDKSTYTKVFAYVIGMDEDADIALLRVIKPKQRFRPVSLASFVAKGLPVLAIGYPSIFIKHVTIGVISSFLKGYTYSDVVIEHGSSGGGVFDFNGRLVGLSSLMWAPSDIPVFQGFTGITSLSEIHKLVDKYKDF